jgi:hypothetical protein
MSTQGPIATVMDFYMQQWNKRLADADRQLRTSQLMKK